MRLSPGFALFFGFAVIGCGSDPADLFTNGGKGSSAGAQATAGTKATGQGGATASNGGTGPSGGASASGGSVNGTGGASGGAGSSAGGTTSNGGAPSSSGGRTTSAGADSRGGAGVATGGAGTAGASSGGAPSSNGGTASGGRASGGAGSVVDCAMLRTKLSTLLSAAQECSRQTNVPQCTGMVGTECGCQVPVNDPDSAETKAYTTALAQLKKQCTSPICAAALCANPEGANCVNSGAMGPHCVATNFAASSGPGFGQ